MSWHHGVKHCLTIGKHQQDNKKSGCNCNALPTSVQVQQLSCKLSCTPEDCDTSSCSCGNMPQAVAAS